MSAPNKMMVEFMREKGYAQLPALASRLGIASSTLVRYAHKAGGDSELKVGRYHFLHVATVEAEVAAAAKVRVEKREHRATKMPDQKWPTRAIGPGGVSGQSSTAQRDSLHRSRENFWDHMRKLVQEELRVVLKDYEIVVHVQHDPPLVEPDGGVIVQKNGA